MHVRSLALLALLIAAAPAWSDEHPNDSRMLDDMPAHGYLARPASGDGPGVLVLHAWWGLNDTIRQVCERLAEEGYVAFAPDLYHGKVTASKADAETLAGAVFEDPARVQEEVVAGARLLAGHTSDETEPIAVIGFSLGAFFALALPEDEPDLVRAVVVFYGTRPGAYGASNASYLGHFAENDPFEPAAAVEHLEQALAESGRPVEFHTYQGTGHWFAEPDRTDAYDEAAARAAWTRTMAFLRESFSK